jgi:hypothetical protein
LGQFCIRAQLQRATVSSSGAEAPALAGRNILRDSAEPRWSPKQDALMSLLTVVIVTYMYAARSTVAAFPHTSPEIQ